MFLVQIYQNYWQITRIRIHIPKYMPISKHFVKIPYDFTQYLCTVKS